jgi:hypothetical protein
LGLILGFGLLHQLVLVMARPAEFAMGQDIFGQLGAALLTATL